MGPRTLIELGAARAVPVTELRWHLLLPLWSFGGVPFLATREVLAEPATSLGLRPLVARPVALSDHEGMALSRLRSHSHVLVDGDLVLRPMNEGDWDVVLKWADDPEVLYFSEGDNIDHRPKEEHQAIYRAVSVTPADMFVFEVNGEPMGDGWLQHMNLGRVWDANPGKECRRVDLELERSWWGKGIGTRAIRLLTAHGFAWGADLVFAVDIAGDNLRQPTRLPGQRLRALAPA